MPRVVFICALCLLHLIPLRSQEDLTERIRDFVKEAMDMAEVVPGLSLAVVKDGEVFFLEGFGLRDVERELPVTAETGFYIASMSKPLMGLAAAQMEYAGRVDLEASLHDIYPDWQLWPPLKSDEISLVDLFSHNHPINNSGLQYRLAFIDTLSQADLKRVMFDFSTPRDKEFRYSNTSINMAAAALEQATGERWQSMIRAYVFEPLSMRHTTSSMAEATRHPFAWPYVRKDDMFVRLETKDDRQMQSAGGHVTTAADFALWLLANLNEGRLNGRQVIPLSVIERAQTPYAQLDRTYYKFHRTAYGLGLYHSDYNGDLLLHHFGGFEGYMAHASFMPEHGIGVAAFSNEATSGARLPHIIAAYVYDLLLGKENVEESYRSELEEWQQQIGQTQDRLHTGLHEKSELLERAAGNPDQWDYSVASFVGTYYNPRIGVMRVSVDEQSRLMVQYGTKQAAMLPLEKQQFVADLQIPGLASPPIPLSAVLDEEQRIQSLNYGGREFRKLPVGTTPEALIPVHDALRQAIRKGDPADVKTLLDRLYPTGAITEPYINLLGYHALRGGDARMAVALFEFNTGQYPHSANAFDSLGEAQLAIGSKDDAIQSYRKSLTLDPDNENARRVLKEIEEGRN